MFSTASATSCKGLTMDSTYFYTACSTSSRVVRIHRTTFVVEDLSVSDLSFSAISNSIVAQDPDNDGRAEVLWVQGLDDRVYICEPSEAGPYFVQDFALNLDNTYGLDIDQLNNVLWMFDDSPNELFRLD
ncbi:MAG: hypothetical protein HC923_09095 [Myxococcales bacterium]|nr:hypothetical protein [Myxococcales bacterium]